MCIEIAGAFGMQATSFPGGCVSAAVTMEAEACMIGQLDRTTLSHGHRLEAVRRLSYHPRGMENLHLVGVT